MPTLLAEVLANLVVVAGNVRKVHSFLEDVPRQHMAQAAYRCDQLGSQIAFKIIGEKSLLLPPTGEGQG